MLHDINKKFQMLPTFEIKADTKQDMLWAKLCKLSRSASLRSHQSSLT